MPVVRIKFITRSLVRAHPQSFFVFGDNLQRRGRGGQAREMRGEPNAIGVATKVKPSNAAGSFLDDTVAAHWRSVLDDIDLVEQKLKDGETVIIPEDGLGTGLAGLQEHAPLISAFIEKKLAEFSREFGKTELSGFDPDLQEQQ